MARRRKRSKRFGDSQRGGASRSEVSHALREAQVRFEEASFWSTKGVKGQTNCDHALKELVKGSTLLGQAQAAAPSYARESGVSELRDRAVYDVQRKCLIGR